MERDHPIIDVPNLPEGSPFECVSITVSEKPDCSAFDSIVVVGNFNNVADFSPAGQWLVDVATNGLKINTNLFKSSPTLLADANCRRVIISPTGQLNRCEDDVRRFFDAGKVGLEMALKAGAAKPLLVVFSEKSMPRSSLVSILGAASATYTNYELRKDLGKTPKATTMGVWTTDDNVESIVSCAGVIEEGKTVCRDLLGSDPENMNPQNFNTYCERLFGHLKSNVMFSSLSGAAQLTKEFPCLAAVDRACQSIDRHRARVIWLNYQEGTPEKTVVLIGKGLTYDTGGADIKAGGAMAGMHRDKGGASAVAGFMHAVNRLSPKNIRIVAGLAVCRNSVGSEAYLADEIITARSGKRVRVGNTDAEGRMAMVDVLCQARERCIKENWENPVFHTIATLTGHAKVAVGNYTAIVPNGPAKEKKLHLALADAGELIGDPFDISSLRREDFEFHTGRDEQSDVYQAAPGPSTRSGRGHQGPAAFLLMASGLRENGLHAQNQIPYCHLDIAGSSGPFPGIASGAPLVGLLQHYNLV